MKKIRDWIKSHQVAAFFIITYALSWPGMFLVFFAFPGNAYVEAFMAPIVFSPALAAMWIVRIAEPEPKQLPDRRRWITFAITWFVSLIVLMLDYWKVIGVDFGSSTTFISLAIFSSIFALFPAWVVSSVFARSPGLRKQFKTLLKPRGPAIWYLVIFLVFPGVVLLDYAISPFLGVETQFFLNDLGFWNATIYLVIDFLRGFLLTGGINEESGWRGFALPRLQARYSVLVSAIIVWFFWAAWHLPYDFGRGDEVSWILENRLLWNFVVAIIMVWLYNRTNGSILAPALFHPAMNTFGNHFSIGAFSRYILIGLALYAIISDRMWRRLPSTHQAIFKDKN